MLNTHDIEHVQTNHTMHTESLDCMANIEELVQNLKKLTIKNPSQNNMNHRDHSEIEEEAESPKPTIQTKDFYGNPLKSNPVKKIKRGIFKVKQKKITDYFSK
jgi:hypothetical protein